MAARRVAPVAAARGARQFLDRAVDGFTGFPGAREVARRHLERSRDVEQAVHDVLEQHLRLAGVQGFVTNLGGITTLPITLPANLAGLALLTVRMAASVAHLRGYDVAEPRVRLAALLAVLGESDVNRAVRSGVLPGTAREIAEGRHELTPELVDRATALVGEALVTRVGGKRVALSVARRVPIVGGGVSAAFDAVTTYQAGRYAKDTFPPRTTVTQGRR